MRLFHLAAWVSQSARIMLLLAIMVVALSAVVPHAAAQDDPPAGFPRTVVDGSGQPVTIPARPERIAVAGAAPMLAPVVPRERLVTVELGWTGPWVEIDLLVLPALSAASSPALVEGAQAAGVPVFRTGAITSLAEWCASVRQLGAATGAEDRAADHCAQLDALRRLLHVLTGHRSATGILVLTPEGYTFGQHTFITDLIESVGGRNLAAAAGFDDFRQIDDATLRALAPDVILLSPGWDAPARAAFLAHPAYAEIPAVQTGRVFRLPFSPTLPPDPAAALVYLALRLSLGL